jgi:RND superfamily putative drug exporter
MAELPLASGVRVLGRIGSGCARHPWRVLGGWLALLVLTVGLRGAFGGTFSDNVSLPGTQTHTGLQLLKASEPTAGGFSGKVVLHVQSGTVADHRAAVEAAVAAQRGVRHVLSISDPLAAGNVSPDATIAVATVNVDVQPKTLGASFVAELHATWAPVTRDGVSVDYGGSFDQATRPKATDAASELIGFGVAILVLLIAFGSVAGALLPLLTAAVSVAIGLSILTLVAAEISFGTSAPTLAIMIGLGVGIDYALFLTTRFRQLIKDGLDPVAAAGRTTATSGHAVLVAAATVSVAMFGLYASGITFIGQLGFAAVFSVATAALGATTLVPAALGLLGTRIDRVAVRTTVAEAGGGEGDGWHRYAHEVARRPWWFFAGGVLVLALLSIPLLSIRLGHVDDGADPTSYTDKRAYDLIAKGFGPGANGPFTAVVQLNGANGQQLAGGIQSALAASPGVAHVGALRASGDGRLLIATVVPATGPQAPATPATFDTLIHRTLPRALAGTPARGYLTGDTAGQLQFRATLVSRLPIIIAVVVATAFLLILMTFRGLYVALKAAVMNLLSIAAAYGVVVAVFQWGWGRGLLGVSENVPIESYVPMLMFAILFGLSMDYEVFLLSRVQEAWHRSGDNTQSVAAGLAATARVISSAALIMISVFSAFALSTQVVIKMLAIGLASSVLIDATVVRLILVPATMTLLGARNWWLPGWLDRVLPAISAEGEVAPTGLDLPATAAAGAG